MKKVLVSLLLVFVFAGNANAFCNAEVQTQNLVEKADKVLHLVQSEVGSEEFEEVVSDLEKEVEDYNLCEDQYPEDFKKVDNTEAYHSVRTAEKYVNVLYQVHGLFK